MTVYHCIFFFCPLDDFVFDSQDIVIPVMNTNTRTQTHTHKRTHMHMVHAHPHSCISLQPCHCHPHTFPSPSTHSSHAQQGFYLAVGCWSPVSTTALNLILWHHYMVSLCGQDAPLNLTSRRSDGDECSLFVGGHVSHSQMNRLWLSAITVA